MLSVGEGGGGGGLEKKSSPLLKFLLKKACENARSASLFYWGVAVESDQCPDPDTEKWYLKVKGIILKTLAKKSPKIYNILEGQIEFRVQMKTINENLVGGMDVRKKYLKSEIIGSTGNFIRDIMPGITDMFILSQDKKPHFVEKTTVWKSKTSPCGIWFNIDEAKALPSYGIMYKNGDDLRMDQLIMQTVSLLDFLMKGVQVDLRLTPYQVLAYSKTDGVLELVPESLDVQEIEEKHGNIGNWFQFLVEKNELKKNSGEPIDEFFDCPKKEARKKLEDNFVNSLAGYCVVTYLLGIGDRHLENIMINNLGKFFHIDFGFAMGEDPNMSKPPPFKLTPNMINAFGGEESPNFKVFCSKFVAYFLKLRCHSNLIINLLYMMTDSDLIVNPNKNVKLGTAHVNDIADKLLLGESDQHAERWCTELLKDSLSNVRARMQDQFHKFASWVK